jgi:hypothetical protein
VVAARSGAYMVEVGIIGRDGVTCLSIIMDTDRSPHETFIQSAGSGWRISASNLKFAMEKGARLRHGLLQ